MKTLLIKTACFAALAAGTLTVVAQPKPEEPLDNKTGVFMTADDYIQDKLTYQIDCMKPAGDNIKVHNLFWKETIDVVYNGKKRTLQKEDVYAYRDCDGATYRFYNNTDYVISEGRDIYIYILPPENTPSGESVGGDRYFFSKGPTGVIKALTVANLQNEFSDNKKFCDTLTARFSHGENIDEYDFILKNYKVIQLYESTVD